MVSIDFSHLACKITLVDIKFSTKHIDNEIIVEFDGNVFLLIILPGFWNKKNITSYGAFVTLLVMLMTTVS